MLCFLMIGCLCAMLYYDRLFMCYASYDRLFMCYASFDRLFICDAFLNLFCDIFWNSFIAEEKYRIELPEIIDYCSCKISCNWRRIYKICILLFFSANDNVVETLTQPWTLNNVNRSYFCNKTQMYMLDNVNITTDIIHAQGFHMVNSSFAISIGKF